MSSPMQKQVEEIGRSLLDYRGRMGDQPNRVAEEVPQLAETLLRTALSNYNGHAPVFIAPSDRYSPVAMLAVPIDGVQEFAEKESHWSIWVGTLVAGRLLMAAVYFPEASTFYQVAQGSTPQSHEGTFTIRDHPKHEPLIAEIGEARFPRGSVPTVPTTVQALSTGQAVSDLIGRLITLAISPTHTIATMLAGYIVKMSGGAVLEIEEGTVWGTKSAVATFAQRSKI